MKIRKHKVMFVALVRVTLGCSVVQAKTHTAFSERTIIVTGTCWTEVPNKSSDQIGNKCPKNVQRCVCGNVRHLSDMFRMYFVMVFFFWAVQGSATTTLLTLTSLLSIAEKIKQERVGQGCAQHCSRPCEQQIFFANNAETEMSHFCLKHLKNEMHACKTIGNCQHLLDFLS